MPMKKEGIWERRMIFEDSYMSCLRGGLDLDDDLMGGDIIICPVCDTDLKLIDVDGVFAAEAV